MSKGSMEFDMMLTKFKFVNENCFRGAVKQTPDLKKVQFAYHIDRDVSQTLLNERERKIKFHFTLEMKPDLGEINFDGECILNSPEQNKVQFCLQNQFPPFLRFIDRIILKPCLENSEKIAKKNNIPFPPVDFFLRLSGKRNIGKKH